MSWQDADFVRRLTVGNAAAKSVLRCLADFRNGQTGLCNPSIATIAAETELDRKTVVKALTYLETKGFITKIRGRRNESSKYNLILCSPKNGTTVVPKTGLPAVPKTGHKPVNEPVIEPGLIHTTYGLSSDDKSSTDTAHPPRGSSSNNPPEKSSAKKEKSEEEIRKSKAIEVSKHCPQQKIIDIYLEELPELTQVCTWTASKRVNNMRARWREMAMNQLFQSEDEGLEFFRTFFQFVKDSKFLMGKIHNPKKEPFKCSLPWLLEPEHFADVIDHKYHDER